MIEHFEHLVDRVWSIYLMMRPELSEEDSQKETVRRYLESQMKEGEQNEEILLTRGLALLMKQGLAESS